MKYNLQSGIDNVGLELARFTQLKRLIRFDDFVMLVSDKGSVFHIASMSLHVQ